MAVEYSSDYINKLDITLSEWTPSDEDYVKLLNCFATFIIKDDCYWGWRNNDKIEDIFNDNIFSFIWNKFPGMRPAIIGVAIEDFKARPICSREMRDDIISSLNDLIPRNIDDEDNKLRASVAKDMCPDYDYMSEVFSLRLIDQDGSISSRWLTQGLSHSKDPAFFAYCWNDIKRGKGYIDKKISVAYHMFSNDAISSRVVEEAASKGTKKLKRAFVEQLTDVLSDVNRKIDWADDDDPLLGHYNNKRALYENYALSFASFDDSNSLSSLAESLSIDNLPWIMPLAGKYSWISRTIERRIDRAEN